MINFLCRVTFTILSLFPDKWNFSVWQQTARLRAIHSKIFSPDAQWFDYHKSGHLTILYSNSEVDVILKEGPLVTFLTTSYSKGGVYYGSGLNNFININSRNHKRGKCIRLLIKIGQHCNSLQNNAKQKKITSQSKNTFPLMCFNCISSVPFKPICSSWQLWWLS